MSPPASRDRVVLAFSGGLDTSGAVGWIQGLPSSTAAQRDLRMVRS